MTRLTSGIESSPYDAGLGPGLALPVRVVAILQRGHAVLDQEGIVLGHEIDIAGPAGGQSEPAQGQDVGVAGADSTGCEGAASPMWEQQERMHDMRIGAAYNASTSASGFKAKECTFIPGFDGPRRCAQTEHVSQQQSQQFLRGTWSN